MCLVSPRRIFVVISTARRDRYSGRVDALTRGSCCAARSETDTTHGSGIAILDTDAVWLRIVHQIHRDGLDGDTKPTYLSTAGAMF